MKFKKNNQILTISYEDDPLNPREWDNLGYFITIDRKYKSPDENELLREIIEETSEEAENLEKHKKLIKEKYEYNSSEEILAIYPIVKYEHSNVSYSLGSKNGFDYSNNGFYIITDKTQREMGIEEKDFEKVIKEELSIYNQYINGYVYRFILNEITPDNICKCCNTNLGGKEDFVDSCGGFYSIDEVFDNLNEKQEDWECIDDQF